MAAGRYQWWVRGINSLGYASRWSSGAVIEIGGRSALISPSGKVSGQVTFSWFQVQGAERYELWVNKFGVGVGVINETALTNAEFKTSSLSAGSYRVWVRAVSNSGQYSAWSQAVDFAVS
jgi:predicted phage tail protein